MWFSKKNVNKRWSQGDQPQASQGTQTLERVDFSFPKSARLLKSWQFNRVRSARLRWTGQIIRIDYHLRNADISKSDASKIGISVSRKYGSAVSRNYFKRVVREAYRTTRHQFSRAVEMNISPIKGTKKSSLNEILEDLRKFRRMLIK